MSKIKDFYSQTPISTTRQVDVDILKMASILFMVVCHVVLYLSHDYESGWYMFADSFLGGFLGAAPAFMISMGLGIVFTKKNEPKDLLKRGVFLFISGYILNFLRTGIPTLILDPADFWDAILPGDILQFAGLSFMVLALIKKLSLKSYVVLIIAVVLSSCSFLFYGLETGNGVLDCFINLIIPTSEDYCAFSFCSWFVFVVVGMLLGNTIQRIKNVDKFYLILLIVSLAVSIPAVIAIMLWMETDLQFYGMIFPAALGHMATSLFLLSVFHFLEKVLTDKIKNFCKSVSFNITPIYCIHWCVVGPVSVIYRLLNLERPPMYILYIGGVVLFVVSYLLVLVYQKVKSGHRRNHS